VHAETLQILMHHGGRFDSAVSLKIKPLKRGFSVLDRKVIFKYDHH
jgi:hypothetical protein